MMSKLVAPLLAVLAVTAVACGDITRPKAALPTLADSATVYALNGAPPGAPTALSIYSERAVSANGSFVFDVAFDLDSAGRIVFLPLRTVANGLTSTHGVGLQTTTRPFDSVLVAPRNGYRYDSTMVVAPGTTVIVESQNSSACSFSYVGSSLHAKVVVDSVNVASRQLHMRFVTDPNCGFNGLGSGVPKE